MHRTKVCVLVAVGAACLIAAAGPGGEHGRRASSVPLVAWMGHFSSAAPGFYRFTDAETWKNFWISHQGERLERNSRGWGAGPEIDFGACMVVAYVRGQARSRDGERLESIDEAGGALRLRFDGISYQTASFGPTPPIPPSLCPYGIWVVPRSLKPVVIEENVQGLKDSPPQWQERRRFDALAE